MNETKYQRPASVTAEQYDAWRMKTIEDYDRAGDLPAFLKSMPQVIEIGVAGYWLATALDAEGCDAEEREGITFALGQMCFPVRDPWATAATLLKQWREGCAPKPGVELADRLLSGDASDLPPGGARLARDDTTITLSVE